MMNITLFSLTLRSLTSMSSFISQQRSISLHRSYLYNSFSPFSYNSQIIHIKSATFGNFLDSVIKLQRGQCVYSQKYSQRPAPPQMNDEIICKDAFFVNCTAQLDGGAFSHYSPDMGTLYVTRSSFLKCNSGPNPGDGGCIYFSGKESRIDSTCVSKCSAGRDGHSFCVSIRNELPNPNHVNQTTVHQSAPKYAARGWQSLYLGFGRIRIIDYNSTNNAVVMQAGSFMMHTIDSDALALHCTIVNNIGPWIIYLFGKNGAALEQSNIVRNTLAKNHEHGIIHFHKFGQINNCFIVGNSGKLFKQNRESAEITVNNCIFDVKSELKESGVKYNNCKFEVNDPKTFALGHLHTAMCVSERDVLKNPVGKADIVMRLNEHFEDSKELYEKSFKD